MGVSNKFIQRKDSKSTGRLGMLSALLCRFIKKHVSKFECEICMGKKAVKNLFKKECFHSYCTSCISKHITVMIEQRTCLIRCPCLDCESILEPEVCRSLVSQKVFDKWLDLLCESGIIESQKFYCPFKDCSALLVNDGVEVVRKSECMNCRRLFCAQCKVPWHGDMSCKDFQKKLNNKEAAADAVVVELAKKNKWKRCPGCKIFVEKKFGCMHIKCSRCGTSFCYACGATWGVGGCQGPMQECRQLMLAYMRDRAV